MPLLIYKYLSKLFLISIAVFSSIFFIIIFLLQLTLNLKILAKKNFDFVNIAIISLLEIPQFFIDIFPFILLFASFYTLRTLNNNKEIEILKSIGLSIYKVLNPFIFIALSLSFIIIFILSSLSVISLKHLHIIKNSSNTNTEQKIVINNKEIWIIDKLNNQDQNIFITSSIQQQKDILLLEDVLFFEIKNNNLNRLITAQKARLIDDILYLDSVISKNTEHPFLVELDLLKINFNVNINTFNNFITNPNQIFIWNLPSVITYADDNNLNSNSYKIYLYNLIALPIVFLIMIIISAIFAIWQHRNQNGILLTLGMIGVGFLIYIIFNLLASFSNNNIAPTFITIICGRILLLILVLNILFHKEKL